MPEKRNIIIKQRGQQSEPPQQLPPSLPEAGLPKRRLLLFAGLALALALLLWLGSEAMSDGEAAPQPEASSLATEAAPNLPPVSADTLPAQPIAAPLDTATYRIEKDILREDLPLRSFLSRQGLLESSIAELCRQAQAQGLERLERGHELLTLMPKNEQDGHRHFAYKISPDKLAYLLPEPLPEVKIQQLSLERRLKMAGGIVKTTLWEAVLDCGAHYKVIGLMEEAMKWSVDFYHLGPGDKFKVVYEEVLSAGQVTDVGRLKAVYFETSQGQHYAFNIERVRKPGFMDEFGQPVQRTFLKCPVKYERISSHYNPERLHPVLKEKRPHLGTDYAAPKGAAIFAVADGTVEEAAFTSNNGNYVKIRHDKTYQTQYLHMNGFATGIKRGSQVAQGQVIGYVGETGLATGPHVCFRFWKNGQQVDHLREAIKRPAAMSISDEDEFLEQKSKLQVMLHSITYFDGGI